MVVGWIVNNRDPPSTVSHKIFCDKWDGYHKSPRIFNRKQIDFDWKIWFRIIRNENIIRSEKWEMGKNSEVYAKAQNSGPTQVLNQELSQQNL